MPVDMKQINLKQELPKLIYVLLNMVGAGLLTFNLLAFKSSQTYGSIWYQDENQTWAMIGVLLMLVAYYYKNWNKLLEK